LFFFYKADLQLQIYLSRLLGLYKFIYLLLGLYKFATDYIHLPLQHGNALNSGCKTEHVYLKVLDYPFFALPAALNCKNC
jgi:hypothetical protein